MVLMVELESEGDLTRSEVALFLREFADEIDDGTFHRRLDQEEHGGEFADEEHGGEYTGEEHGGEYTDEEHEGEYTDENSLETKRVTLIVGGDSATVTVPEIVEFDVEVESRSPMLRSGVHQEIKFELSWEIENPDELDDDRIDVE